MAQTDDFVSGVQAYAEAVRAACNTPADAIRVLIDMAAFDTTPVLGSTTIPLAMETTRSCVTAVSRRAAITSLARACADYQPTSYDDAQQLRGKVAAIMDAEVLRSADAGDRRSYLALRTLRTAVVEDLTVRGATLARLTTVTRAAPLPALLLAQQLYRDATRVDELIAGAASGGSDVADPAFMPLSFQALAT